MFRIKSNSHSKFRSADAQGNYYQWIDNLVVQIKDQMEHLRVPYEKAVADTVDPLAISLQDFETSAWVLSSSMNRDAYMSFSSFRQKGLNFYSSAIETVMTMALYAIEKDIEEILNKKYDVSQFGGKTKTGPLQEMVDQYRIPQPEYPQDESTEVNDTSKTRPVDVMPQDVGESNTPVKGPPTSNLRVPR